MRAERVSRKMHGRAVVLAVALALAGAGVQAVDRTREVAVSVDESVVGQPFPVSRSIVAACAQKSWRSACEPNEELLAKMAEEPREEPWASSAEQAIRALVELEPGTDRPREVTYTIRNLECRKTICFVETASHMQGFRTRWFHFEQDNRLRGRYSNSSTETKADGTQVHVTLLPIVRVPLSTRELSEQRRRR